MSGMTDFQKDHGGKDQGTEAAAGGGVQEVAGVVQRALGPDNTEK